MHEETVGAVLLFVNVTEQMERENLRREFSANVSHELKTPLTLIEGYTGMMREIIEQKQIFDQHLFLLMDGINSG